MWPREAPQRRERDKDALDCVGSFTSCQRAGADIVDRVSTCARAARDHPPCARGPPGPRPLCDQRFSFSEVCQAARAGTPRSARRCRRRPQSNCTHSGGAIDRSNRQALSFDVTRCRQLKTELNARRRSSRWHMEVVVVSQVGLTDTSQSQDSANRASRRRVSIQRRRAYASDR